MRTHKMKYAKHNEWMEVPEEMIFQMNFLTRLLSETIKWLPILVLFNYQN